MRCYARAMKSDADFTEKSLQTGDLSFLVPNLKSASGLRRAFFPVNPVV